MQDVDRVILLAQIDQKPGQADFVEKFFVTFGKGRPHAFSLGDLPPIRSRGHATLVGGETDEHGFIFKTLTNQLANIQLATLAHLGRARIPEVRIVRPNDCLRLATAIEMRHQRFDRLNHVPIAQVP